MVVKGLDVASTKPVVPNRRKGTGFMGFVEMRNNWQLYVMGVPAVVMFVLFSYIPMAGIIIAFKNYNFKTGIFLSPSPSPFLKILKLSSAMPRRRTPYATPCC